MAFIQQACIPVGCPPYVCWQYPVVSVWGCLLTSVCVAGAGGGVGGWVELSDYLWGSVYLWRGGVCLPIEGVSAYL